MPADAVDDSAPFALIARKGEELTYLKYSELKTEIAESDVQGVPYRAETPYRAALCSDRGVYRPGDTAHVAAVLRGAGRQGASRGLPVDLRVVDPREREVKKVSLKTNAAGLVTLDVRFEAFQDTGRYRAVLRVADREVAQLRLQRGGVRPRAHEGGRERAEGRATGRRDEVPVTVEARSTSSAARPRAARWSSRAGSSRPSSSRRRTPSTPTACGGQSGADAKAQRAGPGEGRRWMTKGQVTLRCPAQRTAGGFKGPARLVAQAQRVRVRQRPLHAGRGDGARAPGALLPGPAQAGRAEGGGRQGLQVKGVVVDWDGKLVTDAKGVKPVEVEYLRLEAEYGYYYDEAAGEERYQRFLRPVREGRGDGEGGGRPLQPPGDAGQDAAGFLVRVKAGAAQTDLQLEGDGPLLLVGRRERARGPDAAPAEAHQHRARGAAARPAWARPRGAASRRPTGAACCSPPRRTACSPPSGRTWSRAR